MNSTILTERYLDGKLQGEELLNFEKKLTEDFSFAQQVGMFRLVNMFLLQKAKKDAFIELTEEVYNQFKEQYESRSRFLSMVKQYRAAAVFAFLITLTSLFCFLIFHKDNTPDKIFADNFEHYNMNLTKRSVSCKKTTPLEKATQLYQNKDYSTAVIMFSKLGKEDSEGIMTPFLCGISCLQVDKNDYAIKFLTYASTYESDALYSQVQWYLALAYLKAGNTAEAQKILKRIVASDTYYSAKAVEVLKRIKENGN